MTLPEFSADAALYNARSSYGMLATFNSQQAGGNLLLQRVSGPYGPIGLPGQNWQEACLHMCMMSGFDVANCVGRCLSTCGGIPGGLTYRRAGM